MNARHAALAAATAVAATIALMPVVDAGYTHPTTTHPTYPTTTTTAPTTTTTCPDCTPNTVVATTTSTTVAPTTTSTAAATTTSTTEVTTSTSTTTTSIGTTTSTSVTPNTQVVTTTSTSEPSTTTSTVAPSSTTTVPPAGTSTTTSSPVGTTTTTTTALPDTFTFGAAGTVCVREVPTIRITFENRFPSLAGVTGTLTMRDVNGTVVGVESIVYQPGATVDILYPGTDVNPDGSVANVPGWNLNADGFWVLDPSDAVLREGIQLTYTVNPTAGPVLVEYPPESSACANPDGPFPPTTTVVLPVTR